MFKKFILSMLLVAGMVVATIAAPCYVQSFNRMTGLYYAAHYTTEYAANNGGNPYYTSSHDSQGDLWDAMATTAECCIE